MAEILTPPDIAGFVFERAAAAGADGADIMISTGESLDVTQRLGKQEALERAEHTDIGIRVFVGKKQAMVSGTDFDSAVLSDLTEQAIAMARAVPEDPYCGLEDSYVPPPAIDLDLVDPASRSVEDLLRDAAACEDIARGIDGITNSEGASASYSRGASLYATSNGFAGEKQSSYHSLSISLIAGTGAEMERDYAYSQARHYEDLKSPDVIGRLAAERTLKRLKPRKVKTCRVPVVYAPRVAGSIISHLAGGLSGGAIARGTSMLKDKMGQAVAGAHITIYDDPFLPRGLRAKYFDGEGLYPEKRALVDGGVLQGWLLDLKSARQLKLRPTGNARRSAGGMPSPAPHNLYMMPGTISPDRMIADIENGFYITDMMGSSISLLTGDYSRGASGFWIENGEIAYPVSEVTVAGNLADMWMNMTPANDLRYEYGTDCPTLRIDGMTVAGN